MSENIRGRPKGSSLPENVGGEMNEKDCPYCGETTTRLATHIRNNCDEAE